MTGEDASANPLAAWWREVDRVALAAMAGLLAAGLLCSLAASPAAAARLGVEDPFHFLERHAAFAAASLALILGVSMLGPVTARRAAVLALLGGVGLLAATLIWGVEANGARRWLRLGGLSLQPVEIVKPTFVVTAAWLLAVGRRTGARARSMLAAGAVYAVIAALLLAQPDFGQTALLAAALGGLAFLAGVSWKALALSGVAAAGLAAGASTRLPHVAARIRAFVGPEQSYQTAQALEAIRRGGLFGVGPGEGMVKRALPDAHTDFVFAVAAEELGLVFTLGLIGLVATVVLRLLMRARAGGAGEAGLAAGGLALLIGLQALVNVAVNLDLIPAKGMTLPFVSYGGSSLLAMGFAGGLALALTRRRAESVSRIGRGGGAAAPSPVHARAGGRRA